MIEKFFFNWMQLHKKEKEKEKEKEEWQSYCAFTEWSKEL
jgi:hypothetical protein